MKENDKIPIDDSNAKPLVAQKTNDRTTKIPGYLGGTKIPKAVDDVEIYPLSEFEYHIISDVAQESSFDNFDAFALSAGVSFLVAGIGYICTATFQTEVADKELVNWYAVIFCCIQFILGVSGCTVFFGKQISRKKNESAFSRLDVRIKTHLGITKKPKVDNEKKFSFRGFFNKKDKK